MIFDIEALKRYLSAAFDLSEERAAEILCAAAQSLSENLERAEAGVVAGDYDRVFRAAHSLKGALGNLDLREFAVKAQEIEIHARRAMDYDYAAKLMEFRAGLAPLISNGRHALEC